MVLCRIFLVCAFLFGFSWQDLGAQELAMNGEAYGQPIVWHEDVVLKRGEYLRLLINCDTSRSIERRLYERAPTVLHLADDAPVESVTVRVNLELRLLAEKPFRDEENWKTQAYEYGTALNRSTVGAVVVPPEGYVLPEIAIGAEYPVFRVLTRGVLVGGTPMPLDAPALTWSTVDTELRIGKLPYMALAEGGQVEMQVLISHSLEALQAYPVKDSSSEVRAVDVVEVALPAWLVTKPAVAAGGAMELQSRLPRGRKTRLFVGLETVDGESNRIEPLSYLEVEPTAENRIASAQFRLRRGGDDERGPVVSTVSFGLDGEDIKEPLLSDLHVIPLDLRLPAESVYLDFDRPLPSSWGLGRYLKGSPKDDELWEQNHVPYLRVPVATVPNGMAQNLVVIATWVDHEHFARWMRQTFSCRINPPQAVGVEGLSQVKPD